MNNLRSIGIFLIASTTTLTAISQEDSSSRWDLDRCISHALENNINISQSQLEQKVSALEYTQSKFERLPSINGSASQSLLDPTTTSFGLNANLNIFNGLSTEYQTNILALGLDVSDFVQTEDETRARKFVSLEEVDRMITNAEFTDNQSITALYMYKNWLARDHD